LKLAVLTALLTGLVLPTLLLDTLLTGLVLPALLLLLATLLTTFGPVGRPHRPDFGFSDLDCSWTNLMFEFP
jgi:hypothetical protein